MQETRVETRSPKGSHTNDNRRPTLLLNPATETFSGLDEASRAIMRKVCGFFEDMGKVRLKEDHHQRRWYSHCPGG